MAAAVAVRVFGKPITDGTRAQRAQAAKNNQNAGGKLDDLLQFEKQILGGRKLLQVAAGNGGQAPQVGTVSSTFGKIYNATGDTIRFVKSHNWEGNPAIDYPQEIKNGQWAVLFHVGTKTNPRQGSVAAAVFAIEDFCDILLAWKNVWKSANDLQLIKNKAFCSMRSSDDWDAIKDLLEASETHSEDSLDGYAVKVDITETGNNPDFTATFYLRT